MLLRSQQSCCFEPSILEVCMFSQQPSSCCVYVSVCAWCVCVCFQSGGLSCCIVCRQPLLPDALAFCVPTAWLPQDVRSASPLLLSFLGLSVVLSALLRVCLCCLCASVRPAQQMTGAEKYVGLWTCSETGRDTPILPVTVIQCCGTGCLLVPLQPLAQCSWWLQHALVRLFSMDCGVHMYAHAPVCASVLWFVCSSLCMCGALCPTAIRQHDGCLPSLGGVLPSCHPCCRGSQVVLYAVPVILFVSCQCSCFDEVVGNQVAHTNCSRCHATARHANFSVAAFKAWWVATPWQCL
jgi:hypothetical protein